MTIMQQSSPALDRTLPAGAAESTVAGGAV